MEIKFEVLLSSSIKRRKPWPRFCWLGKEKEGVFLLDDTRISEINLVSGQTKKKTPKLQALLPRVVTMSGSQNGMWLAGILVSGDLFLWNRDKDSLKMVMSVPAVYELVSLCKATSLRLSLLVSGDGQRVLLNTLTGQAFLWECLVPQELCSLRDSTTRGRWSQIASSENARLPSAKDKEASLHCVFVQSQAVGDVCLSAYAFTCDAHLIVTFLMIQWEEPQESKFSAEGYSVQWVTKSYPLNDLVPPCCSVKSRGALVPAISPDGQLLAVVLNQKDPRATQVLFISTQNFVTVTSLLGGCGSKKLSIPPKYVRSYWVGSASWTPGGLYLACVLKRGSLLMLARLGGLVSLSTTGCDIEFGPAHFLPLHPLVTYRPVLAPDDARSGSSASLRDTMRQRYSVTWHPRLPCLIVSDGYMVTVLKVPGRPSSVTLLSNLLLDAARGLERAHALLGSEQPQLRRRLASMPSLKFMASLMALKEPETPMSTLPLFLRDGEGAGSLRPATDRTQVEDEHSDSDEGQYVPSVVGDGGRLEFASMFDTLHAQPDSEPDDSERGVSAPLLELAAARRSLLTAWALGVSLGGAVDQRERMLRYAVSCAVRLARLLRIANSVAKASKSEGGSKTWTSVLDLLRTLLSFLPWDSPHERGRSCFGVVVNLASRFVPLFLTDGVCSAQSFAATILALQDISKSLDQTYSLPQRVARQPQDDRPPCLSDTFLVPLLQEDKDFRALTSQHLLLNRPSKRLVAIWRNLYREALRYQAELYSHGPLTGQSQELENMSNIIFQIQEALQKSGDHLERSHALHNITGEQHFILGEYHQCLQAWQAQLWAESEQAGARTCFLETRYCLALFFTQLFCYRLREAQAMCDSLARQLQSQSGMVLDDDPAAHASSCGDEPASHGWLPWRVSREAACAVVQSLGRFMAAYFTNQPLAILPPHNVDVLPPLHLPLSHGRRVVALSQSRAAGAVRAQHLSGTWTVDYALELLLLGGLLPEAVWLAHSLGDWKTAASLGLAYDTFCRQNYNFSRLKWRELHLPAELQPGRIFQAQLEALVGRPAACEGDTVEAEDVEMLLLPVQEILKASAMAQVDVVSQPLGQLLESVKEHACSLPALVPPGFYLPAPPLYCPQPAPNMQDPVGGGLLAVEREVRPRVAGALQRMLLLLRAARCSRAAACWYVGGLRRCRQLFRKVRKGNVESKDEVLPEGLKKFSNGRGFFRLGPGVDGDMDSVAKQTIVCFRELCGLCWMLHVRDQLTVSCRRYQNARNKSKDFQTIDGGGAERCGAELREEALRWTRRLLAFSRFLSAEEVLQDLALSLVAELPPSLTVAETLAAVFPDEEESVRVSLREKYGSLMQRLGHCSIQASTSANPARGVEGEEEEGEMMMLLVQDQRRQLVRVERRLARSLGPLERHVWEREEEEDRGAGVILNRFSIGTSLSISTLTDGECPLVVSEGDTADMLSEPRSPDLQPGPPHSSPRSSKPQDPFCKSVNEGASKVSVTDRGEGTASSLPVVGTWWFELEDEEYPRFLELFLSYVLEKDGLDGEEFDLPLLNSFSALLHQRELHSDAFDVLSVLKRRQAGQRRGARLPVFRAGHCFRTEHETPDPRPSSRPGPSVLSETGTATPVPGKRMGLFGLREQGGLTPGITPLKGRTLGVELGPVQNSTPYSPQPEFWPFKTVLLPNVEVQVDLDSRLEAQFPQLARLLEWMLRWADRGVLLTQPIRKKLECAGEPVVMRAKASAPAVLSALKLLEQRYSAALLGINRHCNQSQPSQGEFTVAPVLQHEPGWTRGRESSLDTGYPASAGTPITLPDLDLQQGPSSAVCEAEDVRDERCDPSSSGHEDVTSDPDGEREDTTRENEPLPLAESEGRNSDSSAIETLDRSSFGPNISVQIRTQSRTMREPRDQPLTLSDLKGLKMDDDSSESLSEEGTLNSEPAERQRETACRQMVHPPTSRASAVGAAPETASLQHMQQQSAAMPDPVAGEVSASQPPTGSLPQNGDPTPPDPVRQLLNDELFRLVQLQQINFMSLMQVVGASFAHLPVPQGNAVLMQPSGLAPQASGSVVAPPPASPRQSTQDTRREDADRPTSASEPQTRRSAHPDQQRPGREEETEDSSRPSHSALNAREMQQLTIRSDWPKDQTHGCFTAPSQGLLTTVENCAHLEEPPSGRSQGRTIFNPFEKTVPVAQGLRLLQLPPPGPTLLRPPPPAPVREAWGPTPFHLDLSQHKPTVEVTRRRADLTAPPQHLNLNQYAIQVNPPIPEASSDRGTRGDAVRLPPTPHAAAPAMGLPLLRFPPVTQDCPIQLPRLPLAAPTRQPRAGPAAGVSYPRLQLLHTEPEPQSVASWYSTPPPRTPRLLPLEELMARAPAARQRADRKLQLLTAGGDAPQKATSTPSSRRLRRREEKKRARTVGVSFRPEDSIIPSSQPEDGDTVLDDGYALPLGSFDSMLTGQKLLAAAHSTSAELHAFAATHKCPPDIQDAGTNTDPDPPRAVTDKAVTAQLPVTPDPAAADGRPGQVAPVLPPDVFLNLRFPEDKPPDQPNTHAMPVGRRFISVIDLEDDALLQDLPLAPPSTLPSAHAMSEAPPTSAQLHVLAASVINPARTEAEVGPCPDLSAVELDEVHGRLVSVSPSMAGCSGAGGDSVSAGVLTDSRAPEQAAVVQNSVAPTPLSHGDTSARLSEMDARLAALQSIADHMDREFANTRLLVNTIETLGTVAMPSEEDEPHSSPLTDAKRVKSSGHTVRYAAELGNVEEEDVLRHVVSSTPRPVGPPGLRGRSSLSPAAASAVSSARQVYPAATVKPEQLPWDVSQELTESLMENSAIRAETALGLTGLSDVADILGELVREGALSPSELRPSPSAARSGRREEQPREGVVQEDKEELWAWMRTRQRERLVEYHRQREEKRQRERTPFTPRSSVKPSSRDLTINKKIKEERDKQALLEHHSQRAREACSLITDLLSAPLPLRPASRSSTSAPLQASRAQASRARSPSRSTGKRRTPPSRRGRAHSAMALGRTVVLQKRAVSHPPGTLSSRLGLHRPASALPGDRLSQVTRRGMLSDLRGRPRIKTTAQRPKMGLSRFPAQQKSMQQRGSLVFEDTEEREVVSPWDTPLEIRRILGLESKDMGRSLMEDDLDRLDTHSQSTGSMLSKLDWSEIERIVAEEDDV